MRNISDNKSDEELVGLLDSKFLKARVIDHSLVDGLLQLSMKKYVLCVVTNKTTQWSGYFGA